MKKTPVWINKRALLFLHSITLTDHGGDFGLRDEGLLDSALARPKNLIAYEKTSGISDLAASYCAGIMKNHPFVDGNKRAAFLALGLFLELNGYRLTANQPEAFQNILALAAGKLEEAELSIWVTRNVEKK